MTPFYFQAHSTMAFGMKSMCFKGSILEDSIPYLIKSSETVASLLKKVNTWAGEGCRSKQRRLLQILWLYFIWIVAFLLACFLGMRIIVRFIPTGNKKFIFSLLLKFILLLLSYLFTLFRCYISQALNVSRDRITTHELRSWDLKTLAVSENTDFLISFIFVLALISSL